MHLLLDTHALLILHPDFDGLLAQQARHGQAALPG